MDSDLKCNNLPCRRNLSDKAVITTCSHIFCVDCANELFTAAQLCPACETHLTEPDDVVVSSLHPSNDYKTSVLSGLSPSLVLEICGRAISFWQYQNQQENSFQQAVMRNLNERNAQLQKQFDNVVREANGELDLMSSKINALEKELELERKKLRETLDASREKDKEFQKLRTHYDKIKRKALLAPNTFSGEGFAVPQMQATHAESQLFDKHASKARGSVFPTAGGGMGIGAVIGGMEANGVQRTPIRGGGMNSAEWQSLARPDPMANAHQILSASVSDRSASADEVENILGGGKRQINRQIMRPTHGALQYTNRIPGQSIMPVQQNMRRTKGFRPSIMG